MYLPMYIIITKKKKKNPFIGKDHIFYRFYHCYFTILYTVDRFLEQRRVDQRGPVASDECESQVHVRR